MKYYLSSLLFFIYISGYGQSFDWADDGYLSNSHGGKYIDIDGSGVDLEIVGLIKDGSFRGKSTLKTGIYNNVNGGLIHTYQFIFSEKVSLKFAVNDIDMDTSKLCYVDYVRFSGVPTFSNKFGVEVLENNLITPVLNGAITVSYESIDTLTIWHGVGQGCNPGYIGISALEFESLNPRKKKDIAIPIFENLLFESNESTIELKHATSLNYLVEFLLENPKQIVRIHGFTDGIGNDNANLILSKKRAEAVSEYLKNKGVSAQVIQLHYYGENSPIESNSDSIGRKKNRRVEIELLK